jgi:hypothetical protein
LQSQLLEEFSENFSVLHAQYLHNFLHPMGSKGGSKVLEVLVLISLSTYFLFLMKCRVSEYINSHLDTRAERGALFLVNYQETRDLHRAQETFSERLPCQYLLQILKVKP